jgi:hypothetical protein
MASYVSRIIQIVLQGSVTGPNLPSLAEPRDALLRTLTENTSTDVCVEALVEAWFNTQHERPVYFVLMALTQMLELSMEILELVVMEGSREDLTGSSKLLFDLFLKLFDIRNEIELKPKVHLL